MHLSLFLAGVILGPGGEPAAQPDPLLAGQRIALRATTVLTGDSAAIEQGVVLIEDGRIVAVGSDVVVPEGVHVHELEGTLSPGLIGLGEAVGVGGEGRDSTRQVMAEAELVHAFNPSHREFEELLASGVTTAVLSPRAGALVGGVGCVVKSHGGTVIRRRAHLHLGFSRASLSFDRYPTSYTGAIDELNARFDDARGSFAEAAAGRLATWFQVGTRQELERAIRFASARGLQGALVGAPRAGELASAIRGSGLSVVLPAISTGAPMKALETPAKLAEAGVRFGFTGGAPRITDGLRIAAAAARREGLEADRALRAMTVDSAHIAGIGDRVGRLATGLDADLVLWSGDPTDLASAVIAVWVDGDLAYHTPHDQKQDS